MKARARLSIVAVVISAIAMLTACTGDARIYPTLPTPTSSVGPPTPDRPNIVFVLTDDLAWNLLPYMPHVLALQHRGMTFENYTVTDSLCCPSRASIFTGKYPHDTHILTNLLPKGGFTKFHRLGEEKSTFATSLFGAGYRTGFMGKYLNRYYPSAQADPHKGAWVPPGWSTWDAAGFGYPEYNYRMAHGHYVQYYGTKPEDYLTSVLKRRALEFLHADEKHSRPYMLEVATYAPHSPSTPAPIDRGTFPGIEEPQTPGFNSLPSPAPGWLKDHPELTKEDIASIQHQWQLRVESVQSVDRMVGALERAVRNTGQADNTVFVFSSDNGYHMGEHRLKPGKETAFDTDIRVPLIVAGPGIAPDSINTDMVQNIDLRPTFEQLGGASTPSDVDGHSFVPLLHGQSERWRNYALVEHTYDPYSSRDPDAPEVKFGEIPPTYTAIRTKKYIYITYEHSGEHEYYDLVNDPYELHNLGPSLSPARVAKLQEITDRLVSCHGSTACWRASGGSVSR